MNERQRDLFLFLWSQRRKPGLAAISLRGALIGAAGGLLFALLLLPGIDTSRAGYTGLSAIIPLMERGGALLGLSVPAFAFIGWIGARRVFIAQEAMYQSMLAAGAQVPAQKPVMQAADRWPAIMVGVAVAIIVGFIAFLFIAYG